ncbi:MAG: hypothetical protein HQ567_02445 [Candidatus Nealsonbacteria bacterium]|nr:hypothetical protein [Candidatus Nealsonbacteria bacterium]
MNDSARPNRYAFHLRYIGHDDTETLQDVLRTLGKAALQAEQRITDIAETQDGDYIGEVVAEETMLIEDLLGCAFVAAQSYITRIVSRLIWLHKRLERDGHCLTTTNGRKDGLISSCSDSVPGTEYTQIQVINAFANYSKHHDEWKPKWDDETGQLPRRTISVVQAVAASENSSDNCRKGLTALGIHSAFDVYTMAKILAKWHANLTDAYKNELRRFSQS